MLQVKMKFNWFERSLIFHFFVCGIYSYKQWKQESEKSNYAETILREIHFNLEYWSLLNWIAFQKAVQTFKPKLSESLLCPQ